MTAALLDLLQYELVDNDDSEYEVDPMVVVGMEIGGGCLVSQMAAAAAHTHPDVIEVVDFVYCRKRQRKVGTCHRLEGARHITDRTSESPVIKAVWIDDTLVTGGTLRDGILLLKKDFNIEVCPCPPRSWCPWCIPSC